MPRRIASALGVSVVLLLQLALGLLDSACMARMMANGPTVVASAPSDDMGACDGATDVEQAPEPREGEHAPPAGDQAPAVCHALAACGVSYLGAASCHGQPTERALSGDVVFTVAALTSVAFPPDSPPPRA